MNEEMLEMWNDRYSKETYAYGKEANVFFRNTLTKYHLTGRILLPAEGEGRNAVFAAKTGMNVYAFDISKEGKRKAQQLAKEGNVSINYEIGDFFELDLVNEKYDVAALIYAHFPPSILSKYHRKVSELLKKGGMIILEGFSKRHLEYRKMNPKVGGPNKIEMLFTKESIQKDFPDFEIVQLEELEIELNEGQYHVGKGKVVRFIGKKK